MSVLLWCQHLLGTGHLRRALALAAALAARSVPVTLVSGGPPARFVPARGVDLIQLAPVHAVAGDFTNLRKADGQPVDGTRSQCSLQHPRILPCRGICAPGPEVTI